MTSVQAPLAEGRPPTGGGSEGWHDEAVLLAGASATWLAAWSAGGPGGLPARFGGSEVGLAGIVLVAVGLRLWVGSGRRRGLAGPLAVATILLGLTLVGGHRGVRADESYQPRADQALAGLAEVVGDPEPTGFAGWRVELRLADVARVEAVGYGRTGAQVSRATIGQTLRVEGRLRPVEAEPWLRVRHIVARASLTEVEVVAEPGRLRRATEWIRDRIGAGAVGLGDRPRALYRGLVLGDDRFQPMGQRLRFRLAGLSHLLAVSGQNVAFVLAAAAPLIRRLGRSVRFPATLVVLAVFAVITRLEPSVLRAVTAAALSTWAISTGRSRSGLGVLAVAVIALIWADPFLVDSIGFQLSVAASAGILLLGPLVAGRLPGPPWLVAPLAVSLSAQAGVAPIVAHHFGPVSLVAIPANVAAGWAAGAIMIWGMTIGPVAGLLPEAAAPVVQAPVRALLWWLDRVATVAAQLPAPRPSPATVALLVALTLVARARSGRFLLAAVVVAWSVAAVITTPRTPDRAMVCGRDVAWYPAGPDPASGSASVLVVGPRAGMSSIEDCRLAGVGKADLVVARSGARSAATTITALGEVIRVGRVVAPPQHTIVGARRLLQPLVVPTAGAVVRVEPEPSGRRLLVSLERPP